MYAMDFAQVGANIHRQLDIKGMTQQSLAEKQIDSLQNFWLMKFF